MIVIVPTTIFLEGIMAKDDASSINLVIVEETTFSAKVIINGAPLNVLQDDILAIKKAMRKAIHGCKQRKERYDFKTLRDEKIRAHIDKKDDDLLFLALQSLLSRSFSRKAKVAAASNRKSKAKQKIAEAVAKEVAAPLLPARQQSLLFDETPMLNRTAYREDLHLNPLGKKRRARK